MEPKSIAELIKNTRTRSMMTMEEFAATVGVTYLQVYRWESGRAMPTVKHLRAISKRHGVTKKMQALICDK